MKILSASVSDPRTEGTYRNPYLVLEVDEDVRETAAPEVLGEAWLLTRHGPFLAVDSAVKRAERRKAGEMWHEADLGDFNVTRLYKDKLVEAVVQSPDEEIDLAMPLDRARRLLRRHVPDWKYILDDVAGQNGKLQWRLMTPYQRCVQCQSQIEGEVYYRGTYLPLCAFHTSEHNKMIRSKRVATA